MGMMNWVPALDDPIYTLNAFKSSQDEINFSKWEDLNFQRLVDLSEQEVNPFQRSYYLMKAEEILIHDMPAIPLFYPAYIALIAKNLNVNLFGVSLNDISRSFLKK